MKPLFARAASSRYWDMPRIEAVPRNPSKLSIAVNLMELIKTTGTRQDLQRYSGMLPAGIHKETVHGHGLDSGLKNAG
jgi:hypothetical protein